MVKNKIAIGIILLTMLVGMALISTASAQKEDYSVTAEEALKHANANMICFIAADAPGFENWTGASIDPKPQELYDINDQKLFYQFSVYKNNNLIGRIDVCADKTLGVSVNDITFDPTPFNASVAMEKSKKLAKNKYPTGKIESTKMIVYNYPSIGAMTLVKDKTTGDEYRIFVDAYTLDEVEDKPASETELGVWSMYEQVSKDKIDENLKDWQKSDELTKSIEKAAVNKGINISVAVTEENIEKLSADAVTPKASGITLPVPKYGQETDYYCGPASCQMIGKYICNIYRTQDNIYDFQGWHNHSAPNGGFSDSDARDYCYYTQQQGGLGQRGTVIDTALNSMAAIGEINNNRPFFSLSTHPNHFRVCRGYLSSGSLVYLYIIDPLPIGSGEYKIERSGANEVKRIYVRPS